MATYGRTAGLGSACGDGHMQERILELQQHFRQLAAAAPAATAQVASDTDMEFDEEEEQGFGAMVDRLFAEGVVPSGSANAGAAADTSEGVKHVRDDAAALKKRLAKELREQAAGMVRKRIKKN